MRILCCLNADVVSNVALNLLLPSLAGHDLHVALSTRIGAARTLAEEHPARRELRVAEQSFPTEVLFPLVERAAFPDDGARWLTFDELARVRGVPVFALPVPNAGDGLELVRRLAPDLVLSIRYGAIFRPPFIAIPRLGVLNLHAGILPDYRGVIATFRALMHGDDEIGCTLHYVTDGTIDTGPTVDSARVPVDRGRSLFWHVLQLYPPGAALVGTAVERLAACERVLPTRPHADGGAYYTYPTADEWEEFARRGWRTVDPSDLDELWRRYLPADGTGGAIGRGLAAPVG